MPHTLPSNVTVSSVAGMRSFSRDSTYGVMSPDVSLPRQNVTSPLAPSIALTSITSAPSVAPVSVDVPPPPPPSSSSPHAATSSAHAVSRHSSSMSLLDINVDISSPFGANSVATDGGTGNHKRLSVI